MTRRLPRVVAVGFNKCATRSIANIFERAGHRTIHQKVRRPFRHRVRIGRLMRENLAQGRPVFSGVEDFDVFCDLMYATPSTSFDGNSAFREILRDYPDTILLLNHRNEDDWIRSRFKHGHGAFAEIQMQARGLESRDALEAAWRQEHRDHLAAVRSFMADRPAQLVDFDLDKSGGAELARAFPEWRLDPADWGDIGRSRGRRIGPVGRALKTLNARLRSRLRR